MTEQFLPNDQQEDFGDAGSYVSETSFNAVVTATDWTTQTILSQLKKGNIELNPNFQRRDAWKVKRKSQFIESLILGIPVPQIVLAERKEKRGTYIVIDGKQRLLALSQFSAGPNEVFHPFSLRNLDVRRDLIGLSYDQLMLEIQFEEDASSFENQTIRTVVIRNWPDEAFLYLTFLRLNTGSVQLSPQELRQALHPGPFTSFVDDYSIESQHLKKILRIQEPDFRMRDAELVIRYFAFRNYLDTYTGNLKPLLDYTARHLNAIWDIGQSMIFSQVRDLENAIDAAIEIFGERDVFRKWNGEKFESALNRAIFDIMVAYFIDGHVANESVRQKERVREAFKEICTLDSAFLSSIEGTTKSIDSIFTRLSIWGERLADTIEVPIPVARLENNKIILAH